MTRSHFVLLSSAFQNGEDLPERFCATAENLSPPLNWAGIPGGARELVLLCENTDVQDENGPLVHWLAYRIPVALRALPEGCPPGEQLSEIAGGPLQGINYTGRLGYAGPLPALGDGWHHYRFRLIALRTELQGLQPGMTREQLFQLMDGEILGEAVLVGRFERRFVAGRAS